MGGFRNGLLVGVLAGAVVALAVALMLTLSDEDEAPSKVVIREREVPAPEPEEVKTPAKPAVSRVVNFQAPSGNILCRIDATKAACGIGQFTYTPPAKPASCQLAGWGQFVAVERQAPAGFLCADGIPAPFDSPVLEYGRVLRTPAFECGSSEEGVYCEDRASGHGFALSRERFSLR